jgi:indolepyruvate ferredoxin oxidoreductase beta subunit
MVSSPGSNPTSVVIAAVGGQGALLATRVLARYATLSGHDVKVSEIHGMSQRGGSVVTHVRFGQAVHSPVVELGTADAVIAFELLEAARYAPYVRPGGLLIASTQRISPLPVLIGAAAYPDDLERTLATHPVRCLLVDAQRRAEDLGSVRTANTLLLGVLAFHFTSEIEPWREAVRATIPPEYHRVNLAALDAGWALYADECAAPEPVRKGMHQ